MEPNLFDLIIVIIISSFISYLLVFKTKATLIVISVISIIFMLDFMSDKVDNFIMNGIIITSLILSVLFLHIRLVQTEIANGIQTKKNGYMSVLIAWVRIVIAVLLVFLTVYSAMYFDTFANAIATTYWTVIIFIILFVVFGIPLLSFYYLTKDVLNDKNYKGIITIIIYFALYIGILWYFNIPHFFLRSFIQIF